MKEFSKRLKKLRIGKQLTQAQLARHMQLSQAAVAKWEANDREPAFDKLLCLCNLFHVSADYLLGRSDD